MSKKHFSWLLMATLLIGALVIFLPGGTSKDSEFDVQNLLPGLADKVNSVDQVTVITAGAQTIATLKRQDDGWVVEEFQDYPANWSKLRELLAAMAKARIIEPKTSNSEYFSRLGVSDVSDAESQATLLELKGEQLDMALLVGNPADGREGQYVRMAGGDRALLVDQKLDLPAEAKDWLQRDIVNISDAEVVEFSLQHSDGAVIKASKVSADDDDFVLQDIPEGREILSAWSVNSLANALSNLQLDAVAKAETVDFTHATQFQLLTADGLEVQAELVNVDEQDWLRLVAGVHESAAEDATLKSDLETVEDLPGDPGLAASDDELADESSDNGVDETPVDQTEADTKKRADEINHRVGDWAYAIPSFKADTLQKNLDDLLKPLPETE